MTRIPKPELEMALENVRSALHIKSTKEDYNRLVRAYSEPVEIHIPIGELAGNLAGFAWVWEKRGRISKPLPITKSDSFNAQGLEGKVIVSGSTYYDALIVASQTTLDRIDIYRTGKSKTNPDALRRSNPSRRNPTITPEAHELYLFAISDGDLYRQQGEPIIKNLARKHAKGIFKRDLAVKLYTYLADNAAKKYEYDHGTGRLVGTRGAVRSWREVKGYGIFTTAHRREAAAHLLDHYMEQIDATARVLLAKTKLFRTGDGKRFHSEQAARDHANIVFKRTGNIIAVERL